MEIDRNYREMDGNCREMDGNCREIDLIRSSYPPEREREREMY